MPAPAIVRRAGGLAAFAAALAGIHLGRRRMLRWGATWEEVEAHYADEALIPGAPRASVMATTFAAPPAAVWPWLVQMGCDRAGFYSWNRLDNGGNPSADRIHPEWQDLQQGGRILAVPDGSVWFDAAVLEPERTLILRSSLALPTPVHFDPAGRPPRAFNDSTWGFFLRPTDEGGTRLVVTGVGRGEPAHVLTVLNRIFWEPAHWVMQTRQFAELHRRIDRPAQPAAAAAPAPA